MKSLSMYLFALLLVGIVVNPFLMYGQRYNDYLGAGHTRAMTVTASSNRPGMTPIKTINGTGQDDSLFNASRFLYQSSFGAKKSYIQSVSRMGFEPWINDQFTKPISRLTPRVESVWQAVKNLKASAGQDTSDIFGPYSVHFNYAYWQMNLTNEDLLRQRVAQSLSEIFVISIKSGLTDWAEALASYYDILSVNAFGNYKDILKQVSVHPSMGYYLSHLNNAKTNIAANTRPDENFAREIMQLFSIGLYELNINGTRKLDAQGKGIPTYDNNDIKEMAKVWTGLGAGAMEPWVWWTTTPYFGLDIYGVDKTKPLAMYNNEHEPGQKILFKTQIIPSGQTGMQDIDQAINILFNHPNVGPFMAKRMIQRMVKSNPSPAYIARVATAFNGSGSTPRGDMKAFIKAILLDPEARNRSAMNAADAGMLRPPLLRALQYARSMELISSGNRFWHNGFDILNELGHHVLGSPTVFNFYPSDFQPNGPVAAQNMEAPEFKIHNSSTAVNWVNKVHHWTFWDFLFYSWEGDSGDMGTKVNYAQYVALSDDPEKMMNELDIILTHGQLTDATKATIRQAIKDLKWPWNEDWRRHRVNMMIYLIMISPDYTIIK